MGLTFVLALATLAAFAQAVPTYSGPSRLASVGSFGRNVGHHGRGHVDTKLGVAGHGGFNKYDAGRLVHDAVYNPRRVGGSGFGGSRLGGSFGRGGQGGFINPHDVLHSHQCNCRLGEVCTEDRSGRSFCQPAVGAGLGFGGGHLGGNNQCQYLEYPSDCVRSRSRGLRNTITRYTFYNGHCQSITTSRISSWCRPQGSTNNIFRSRYECQNYCGI